MAAPKSGKPSHSSGKCSCNLGSGAAIQGSQAAVQGNAPAIWETILQTWETVLQTWETVSQSWEALLQSGKRFCRHGKRFRNHGKRSCNPGNDFAGFGDRFSFCSPISHACTMPSLFAASLLSRQSKSSVRQAIIPAQHACAPESKLIFSAKATTMYEYKTFTYAARPASLTMPAVFLTITSQSSLAGRLPILARSFPCFSPPPP